MTIIGILLMRLYLGVIVLLILNSISMAVFNKHITILATIMSIIACIFWPVAMFSQEGRKHILNRMSKL